MAALHPNAAPTPNAGDYLTSYINARAGRPAIAQWFRRESNGCGAGLGGINLAGGLEGRTLSSAAFRPCFWPLLATTRRTSS